MLCARQESDKLKTEAWERTGELSGKKKRSREKDSSGTRKRAPSHLLPKKRKLPNMQTAAKGTHSLTRKLLDGTGSWTRGPFYKRDAKEARGEGRELRRGRGFRRRQILYTLESNDSPKVNGGGVLKKAEKNNSYRERTQAFFSREIVQRKTDAGNQKERREARERSYQNQEASRSQSLCFSSGGRGR